MVGLVVLIVFVVLLSLCAHPRQLELGGLLLRQLGDSQRVIITQASTVSLLFTSLIQSCDTLRHAPICYSNWLALPNLQSLLSKFEHLIMHWED